MYRELDKSNVKRDHRVLLNQVMYKSKAEIEKKLSQTKYNLKQLTRFEGRFFVNQGRDHETGSYPLIAHLSSFLSSARSIFQYALKEAKNSGLQKTYEGFFDRSPVSKLFRDLRDDDIHQYMPGTHVAIEGITHIDPETGVGTGKFSIEKLDDLDNPKDKNSDMTITTSVTRRIEVSPELIDELQSCGQSDLVDAARRGDPLYTIVECDGENDLFALCRKYMADVEAFFEYGQKEGFIT